MSLVAARLAGLLEAALLVAGASPDTPKTAAFALDVATAVVSEITGNATVPSTGLLAPPTGGPVTGAASVTGLDADSLKTPLRAALIAAGAADSQDTTDFASELASAIVDEVQTYATVPGTGLVATNTMVSPGPVTGTAALASLNALRLTTPIKNAFVAIGAADGAATLTLAGAIAAAIVLELGFAVVTPLMASIAGGGPITGAGAIS